MKQEYLCEIFKDNNDYYIKDLSTLVVEGPLKISKDKIYLLLPKNNIANRKCVTISNLEKILNSGKKYLMTYKKTKVFGTVEEQMLRNKVLEFLTPTELEEFRTIVHRAAIAKLNAKNKPLTKLEKINKQLEYLYRKRNKLLQSEDML